jgi:glutamine cyclotransferase
MMSHSILTKRLDVAAEGCHSIQQDDFEFDFAGLKDDAMSANLTPIKTTFTRRSIWILAALLVLSSVVGITAFAQFKKTPKGEVWGFRVDATYPHDQAAFTQGLVFTQGRLLEGTGKKGESSLRLVDLKTGKVQKQADLNAHYFGEGITVIGPRIYQLTWQNRIGLVYDIETFDLETTFQYTGEGWGLTNDGKRLIMSDGTATLRFLDPGTFEVVKRITVRNSEGKVSKLNELEYVNGEIWANIWYEDRIARVSPESGEVLGWIDLSGLYPRSKRGSNEDVLNGIAYDPESKRLLVTGKNWPKLYEITVKRK